MIPYIISIGVHLLNPPNDIQILESITEAIGDVSYAVLPAPSGEEPALETSEARNE